MNILSDPVASNHISPLFGAVGADPVARLNAKDPVVDALIFRLDEVVGLVALPTSLQVSLIAGNDPVVAFCFAFRIPKVFGVVVNPILTLLPVALAL
jgi:hypothetical protein